MHYFVTKCILPGNVDLNLNVHKSLSRVCNTFFFTLYFSLICWFSDKTEISDVEYAYGATYSWLDQFENTWVETSGTGNLNFLKNGHAESSQSFDHKAKIINSWDTHQKVLRLPKEMAKLRLCNLFYFYFKFSSCTS